MQETQVQSLGWEDPLEKEVATHSSILAWEIPWMEKPGWLQSMGSSKSWTHLSNSLTTTVALQPVFFLCLTSFPCPGSRHADNESESESRSVVSSSLRPHGLYSPWNSPGRNTVVGSVSLLQGIFSTQGSNPSLLCWQMDSLPLSHQGNPGCQ